jgi:hypothetical protein
MKFTTNYFSKAVCRSAFIPLPHLADQGGMERNEFSSMPLVKKCVF